MEFLVKVKPENGECLSSYIQRVASNNFITPGQLWKYFNSNKYIYSQSAISQHIDLKPNLTFDIHKFVEMTNISDDTLENLTFLPILKRFTLISNTKNFNRYVDTKRKFCSRCLKENNVYKLIWQVKGINYCETHLNALNDKCWRCNKPITLLGRYSEVGICSNCKSALKFGEEKNYIPDIKEKLISNLWNFLLELNYKNLNYETNIFIERNLAIRLLFLLKDYDSSPAKRILNRYVNNNFTLNNFAIDMNLVIKILLQTNTSFKKFMDYLVPENFTQSLLNRSNVNYKINYFII